jgi:cytochrome P450
MALDRLEGRTEFDLMKELAEPIPVACIGAIPGVPPETLASFHRWLDGIVQTFNPNRTQEEIAALAEASNGLVHFMRDTLAARKPDPRDDLFSGMARIQAEGARSATSRSPSTCAAFSSPEMSRRRT